jgi:hypothetical protein
MSYFTRPTKPGQSVKIIHWDWVCGTQSEVAGPIGKYIGPVAEDAEKKHSESGVFEFFGKQYTMELIDVSVVRGKPSTTEAFEQAIKGFVDTGQVFTATHDHQSISITKSFKLLNNNGHLTAFNYDSKVHTYEFEGRKFYFSVGLFNTIKVHLFSINENDKSKAKFFVPSKFLTSKVQTA